MPEITDWRRRRDRYLLNGYKCKGCGKVYSIRRFRCLRCGCEEFSPVQLPRNGNLLYHSIIRSPPRRFKKYAPYAIGLIRLENDVSIISQIVDVSEEEIRKGLELEASFRILYEYGRSGHIIYGTKFRPKVL